MTHLIQKIILYKTLDGQLFSDKHSAKEHFDKLKYYPRFNDIIAQQETLEKMYESYEWEFSKCNCHNHDNSRCLKHFYYCQHPIASITHTCDCDRF